MSSNPIDQFIDRLIEQSGLSEVSEDKKQEYHQTLLGLVQQKLGMEFMKMLPPDNVDEFVSLAEKEASSEKMLGFFQKNIPDFENKVVDILKSFEQDFIHILQQFNSFSQGK